MSEKNNELFVGTPDDNVSPDDFKEITEDIYFMTPLDDDDEYYAQPHPFDFLRKMTAPKEQKAPKVRKIRKVKQEPVYDELDVFVEAEAAEIMLADVSLPVAEEKADEQAHRAEPEETKAPAPEISEKKEKKRIEKAPKAKPEKAKNAEIKPKTAKKSEKKPKVEKEVKAVKAEKKPLFSPSVSFILTLTFKLFLICSVVAAMLAIVNTITAPIIEENQFAEKKAIIEEFFPNITSFESLTSDKEGVSAIYLIKENDTTVGYCADVISSGFSGDMNMIVGVDTDCNIKGIKIISHAETPGFGTKVVEDEDYLKTYHDLGKAELVLGVDIDAMSGVTSTSTTVNKGVNLALSVFEEVIGGAPSGGGSSDDTAGATDAVSDNTAGATGTVSDDTAGATGTVSDLPEKATVSELDALVGLYGWVTDLEDPILYDGESPFDTLIFLRAGGSNIGYVAITNISTEFETVKILVGTWFNTVLGVRVLDYEGETFDKIARHPEYLINNYKNKTSFAYGTDIPAFEGADAEAEAIAYGVANVFKYYPTYLEKAKSLTEVTPNE